METVNFLSEPDLDDSLRCPICIVVAQDPWQHSKCGKLFCKDCLLVYDGRFSSGEGSKPCPYCMMESPTYFEDSKSKQPMAIAKIELCYVLRAVNYSLRAQLVISLCTSVPPAVLICWYF